MTDLTLYTNPMSRGRIARFMLEEVGQPYDTRVVGYGEEMKAPDYLALNPMGKVPTLTHGQTVVTEGAAICAYLADAFPDAGLAPPPGQRGAYYRWLFFGAGPVEAAVTNAAMGVADTPEMRPRVGYGSLSAVEDALEGLLADGRPWLLGQAFSAVDVYTGSQIAYGLRFNTMGARPGFSDYVSRLMERPAARAATAKDDAVMPADG